MLCATCSSILEYQFRSIERKTRFPHHASASSLRSSVSQGCYVCRAFANELFDSTQEADWNQDLTGLSTRCSLSKRAETVLSVTVRNAYTMMIGLAEDTELFGPAHRQGNFTIFVLQPSSDVEERIGRPSTATTVSDECWNLATRWLADCRQHHQRCREYYEAGRFWPTRLLDLDPRGDGSGSDFIRLIVCKETPPVGQHYLTLSYRWGTKGFICLTKRNIDDFRTGIALSLLPQTFRDTIMVARRLGIRYLWIDSLCIMQDRDDLSDWQREAGKMQEVYSSALLNISATGAASSFDGLFAQRAPDSLVPPEVQLCVDNATDASEAPRIKYRILRTAYWQTELSQAPLMKRAWVLQERLLAPRVLHFGQNELLWECQELTASETFPNGVPGALTIDRATHFKRLDPQTDGRRLRQRGLQDMEARFFAYELWKRIVEEYSGRALTYHTDKLVALSGLAKRMARITRDPAYLVGLWRFCLASQLLWYVPHRRQADNRPSARPAEYRAPTFSWASVDGCIEPGDFTDQGMLIDVVDVRIDAVTDDVTGSVKGGVVCLTGALKRLRLEREAGSMKWMTVVNGVDVRSDSSRPAILLDVDHADFADENDRASLYLMPARVPFERYQFFVGLVLESADHGGAVRFRRLGVLITSIRALIELLLEPHGNARDLPCDAFDEASQRHTISLI